jgi:hypothetical protein
MLPLSSDLPAIIGTPTVGNAITASSGTWDGPAPTYAYQWDRCNSSGACSAILTATTQYYIPAATDVGSTLRVVITATNKNGSAVATSPASATVTAPSISTTSTSSTTAGSTTTSGTTTTVLSPTTTTASGSTTTTTSSEATSAPPAKGGYFSLQPVGAWATLPSGGTCTNLVRRSAWEPRPDNYKRNHIMPDPQAVHGSFAARPRSGLGTYDPKWDSWLLPRVDGQFTGTTDEIFQWAACKWGLPDDLVRAVAYGESTWYQYETYPSGRCVTYYGCGDWFSSEPYSARNTYCDALARYGYDYQLDYGDGLCPKTFSIIGEMSWWNPSWGFNWPDNQNGTFPFSRNSTAFAVDYYGSQMRGCYEDWQWELGSSYAPGDLWGCVGSWYSGGWHDAAADGYAQRVQAAMNTQPWLTSTFAATKPPCDPTYGCPVTDRL